MKFGLKKNDSMMQHLMFSCGMDALDSIRKTPQWKDEGILEATLQINGVDIPAEVMESFMKSLWERAKSHYEEQTNADEFKSKVENRAKELLSDSCGGILSVLNDLQNKLSDVDNLIKYNWE